MHRYRLLCGFIVVCGIILAGCSLLTVRSDYDHSVDFSLLRSYTWTPDPAADIWKSILFDDVIKREIESTLTVAGYRKLSKALPDFFLQYYFAETGKIRIPSWDRYRGHQAAWKFLLGQTQVVTQECREGTLVIDALDPQTRRLMWRGSTQIRNYQFASSEDLSEGLTAAIQKILNRFPSH